MKRSGKMNVRTNENDFDIVAEQLKNGLSRLSEITKNAKLSAEQQETIRNLAENMRTMITASEKCSDVEQSYFPPEIRNEQIGKFSDVQELKFDDVFKLFGYPVMNVDQKNTIDTQRILMLKSERSWTADELLASVGLDNQEVSEYQID